MDVDELFPSSEIPSEIEPIKYDWKKLLGDATKNERLEKAFTMCLLKELENKYDSRLYGALPSFPTTKAHEALKKCSDPTSFFNVLEQYQLKGVARDLIFYYNQISQPFIDVFRELSFNGKLHLPQEITSHVIESIENSIGKTVLVTLDTDPINKKESIGVALERNIIGSISEPRRARDYYQLDSNKHPFWAPINRLGIMIGFNSDSARIKSDPKFKTYRQELASAILQEKSTADWNDYTNLINDATASFAKGLFKIHKIECDGYQEHTIALDNPSDFNKHFGDSRHSWIIKVKKNWENLPATKIPSVLGVKVSGKQISVDKNNKDSIFYHIRDFLKKKEGRKIEALSVISQGIDDLEKNIVKETKNLYKIASHNPKWHDKHYQHFSELSEHAELLHYIYDVFKNNTKGNFHQDILDKISNQLDYLDQQLPSVLKMNTYGLCYKIAYYADSFLSDSMPFINSEKLTDPQSSIFEDYIITHDKTAIRQYQLLFHHTMAKFLQQFDQKNELDFVNHKSSIHFETIPLSGSLQDYIYGKDFLTTLTLNGTEITHFFCDLTCNAETFYKPHTNSPDEVLQVCFGTLVPNVKNFNELKNTQIDIQDFREQLIKSLEQEKFTDVFSMLEGARLFYHAIDRISPDTPFFKEELLHNLSFLVSASLFSKHSHLISETLFHKIQTEYNEVNRLYKEDPNHKVANGLIAEHSHLMKEIYKSRKELHLFNYDFGVSVFHDRHMTKENLKFYVLRHSFSMFQVMTQSAMKEWISGNVSIEGTDLILKMLGINHFKTIKKETS